MEDLNQVLEQLETIRICSLIMATAIVISTLVTVTIKLKDEFKKLIFRRRIRRDHIGELLREPDGDGGYRRRNIPLPNDDTDGHLHVSGND